MLLFAYASLKHKNNGPSGKGLQWEEYERTLMPSGTPEETPVSATVATNKRNRKQRENQLERYEDKTCKTRRAGVVMDEMAVGLQQELWNTFKMTVKCGKAIISIHRHRHQSTINSHYQTPHSLNLSAAAALAEWTCRRRTLVIAPQAHGNKTNFDVKTNDRSTRYTNPTYDGAAAAWPD